MKNLINISMLFFIFPSCSVVKKNSHLEKSKLEEHATITSKDHLIERKITLSNDSLDTERYIEFYPQGIFSYSVENGFKGEASRVNIREKAKIKLQTHIAEQKEQQASLTTTVKKTVMDGVKTKSKERLVFNWFLWLLGLGVLGIGLAWLIMLKCRGR